ncbi:MAG TPA: TMEM175 family protein [Nitrososphaeraceae archaeon]
MIKNQLKVDHILAFADAIFAFSITFMAVSIHIPELPRNLTEAQVIHELLKSIPEFEIYVISFFVIGIYWISYHQLFNHIESSSSILTWLTLIFLFFITLIPFATNLQVGFGQYQIIFILFALVLTIGGFLQTMVWGYATKNKLIDESLTHDEIHYILLGTIVSPAIFLLSILVSFVDIQFAYYFWILIIPADLIVRKRYSKLSIR